MRKKLIFLSLLLIIIGVVGCFFTYNTSNNMTQVNQIQTIDGENINTISIETITIDIEIIATKEQHTEIELIGNTDEKNIPHLSIKNEDGHLKIDVEEAGKNKWLNINVNFTPRTLKLKVYVPEKLIDTIEFKSVSADVSLENVEANQIKLTTTSGDMNGTGIQANTTTIKTVSGDINFEDTTGAYVIKTTSGDLYLQMENLIHPIKINSISGDVKIETSNIPTDVKFNIKTISGDVNILDEYNGSTVIGQGTTLVQINTTSADISVNTY